MTTQDRSCQSNTCIPYHGAMHGHRHAVLLRCRGMHFEPSTVPSSRWGYSGHATSFKSCRANLYNEGDAHRHGSGITRLVYRMGPTHLSETPSLAAGTDELGQQGAQCSSASRMPARLVPVTVAHGEVGQEGCGFFFALRLAAGVWGLAQPPGYRVGEFWDNAC